MHYIRTFCAVCSLALSVAASSAFALGAPPSPAPRPTVSVPTPRPNVYVPPPTVPSGAVQSGTDAARGGTGGVLGAVTNSVIGGTISGGPPSPTAIDQNNYGNVDPTTANSIQQAITDSDPNAPTTRAQATQQIQNLNNDWDKLDQQRQQLIDTQRKYNSGDPLSTEEEQNLKNATQAAGADPGKTPSKDDINLQLNNKIGEVSDKMHDKYQQIQDLTTTRNAMNF